MPPQTTENTNLKEYPNEETTETETDENSVSVVNTRFHTVFINTATTETGEKKIFEHINQETGVVTKMGEGEVKRYLRVYNERVLKHEKQLSELQNKGETAEMISKKETVLENNRKQLEYWETALSQITDAEQENSNLRIAT